MKKRGQKQQDVEALSGDLAKVSTVILTTFQGITVAEDMVGRLWAEICPPCRSMMAFTMDRPSPLPFDAPARLSPSI